MLSRLALRNAQMLPVAVHAVQRLSSSTAATPRPKRPIDPSPVRHGFIPEEWFTVFYPKTGATGSYMFFISVGTYLLSKEIYVLEHETFSGIPLFIMCLYATKKYGPQLAEYLDGEVDKWEQQCNDNRTAEMQYYEDGVQQEKKQQWRMDGQKMIMDIKKVNVQMQLEATYRERMMKVYEEVKRRLDYQLQLQSLDRRLAQKHMADWIVNEVMKAITPDQEKAALQQCIKDLEVLAVKA